MRFRPSRNEIHVDSRQASEHPDQTGLESVPWMVHSELSSHARSSRLASGKERELCLYCDSKGRDVAQRIQSFGFRSRLPVALNLRRSPDKSRTGRTMNAPY